MAERKDLDFTYSLTDRVVRLSLGELADFSGAKYDGDFSLSLEQAQRRKRAPWNSDAWILALMGRQFPGWRLPSVSGTRGSGSRV